MVEARENVHKANITGHVYKETKGKKAETEQNKTDQFSFQVAKSR